MTDFKQWEGFEGRIWKEEVNTRDFIQKNWIYSFGSFRYWQRDTH